MGQKILRCPFCIDSFKTISSYRSKRLKICPYCEKDFFYFRGVYYIRIADIKSLKIELIQPTNEKKEKIPYNIDLKQQGRILRENYSRGEYIKSRKIVENYDKR